MLKKIYEQLGLDTKYEDEIRKFNSRILRLLDDFRLEFFEHREHDDLYPLVLKEFAFLAGISDIYGYDPERKYYFELKKFFGQNDFEKNILNLTLLFEVLKKDPVFKYYHEFLKKGIEKLFAILPMSIGFFFNGETIIRQGARELDEKLISENLSWLSDYPATKKLYENSLIHYLAKHYEDAITNAYSALEGLVKTYLVLRQSPNDG